MAGELKTRISLTGGEEVKRAFEQIGQAGRKAFTDIQRAATAARVDAGLVTAFARTREAIREVTSETGLLTRGFDQFRSGISLGVSALTTLTAALTLVGAAGTAAFIGLTKGAVTAGEELRKLSLLTSTSAKSIQTLRFAATESGVAVDSFSKSFTKIEEALRGLRSDDSLRQFAQQGRQAGATVLSAANNFGRLGEAVVNGTRVFTQAGVTVRAFGAAASSVGQNLSETQRALVDLGAVVDPLTGKLLTAEQSLLKLADRFATLPDGPERTALGIKVFGDAFADIEPLLRQGSAGIEELRRRLEATGLALSDADREALRLGNIAFSQLGGRADLLKAKLGAIAAPAVVAFFGALTSAIDKNGAAITAFATTISGQVTSALTDLIFLLGGGTGPIENTWILDAIANFESFTAAINSVYDTVVTVVGGISTVLGGIADTINTVFGTELSGADVGITLLVARFLGGFQIIGAAATVLGALLGGLFGVSGAVILGVVAGFAALAVGAALVWPKIREPAIAAGNAILTFFGTTLPAGVSSGWESVRGTITSAFERLQEAARPVGERIAAAFDGVGERIRSRFAEISDNIGGLFDGLATRIRGSFANLGDGLRDLFSSIGSLFASAIDGALTRLARVVDLIRGAARDVANLIVPSAQAAPAQPGGQPGAVDFTQTAQQVELLRQDGTAAFASLQAAGEAAAFAIATAFGQLIPSVGAVWAQLQAGATSAFTAVTDAAQTAAVAIQELLARIADNDVFGPLAEVARIAFDQIAASAGDLGTAITRAITDAAVAAQSALQQLVSSVTVAVSQAIQQLDALIQRAQEAAAAVAAASSGGGGGGGGEGFAGGGFVSGSGTSTSDSIPAWLSNGEFVVRAAAVRKYGTNLLAQLNRLRMPKGLLRGFASGGLVKQAASPKISIPRFATGGLVDLSRAITSPSMSGSAGAEAEPMRVVNISIGGQGFGPMLAPADVASRLQRWATGQQMRSAGQKPGWA
jgi:hypothetical protein